MEKKVWIRTEFRKRIKNTAFWGVFLLIYQVFNTVGG